MRHLIISICFILVFLSYSCGKECRDAPSMYEFVIPASVIPSTDTLHVGDTLYITIDTPTSVYERNTQEEYQVADWQLYTYTKMRRMDVIPEEYGSEINNILEFTDPLLDPLLCQCYPNTFSGGTSGIIGDLGIVGDRFRYEIALILKKEGVYQIDQVANIDWDSNFPLIDGMCEGRAAEFVMDINNGHHSNAYLLHESPSEYFNTWVVSKIEERFYDQGGFCIVVLD